MEVKIERLNREQMKNEIFKREMDLFKQEYQEKIIKIKNKLSSNKLLDELDEINSHKSSQESNSNINYKKITDLEKIVDSLLLKNGELTKNNEKKDKALKYYKVSYKYQIFEL